MQARPVIILTGPTASGKTGLSLKMARASGCEIISADSMQVYRRMDIGTAKISLLQMEGIPHHLIDILEPDEAFSAALFKEKALEAAKGIWERGRVPLIVGGTGFYIQGFLYDIDFGEGAEGGAAPDDETHMEETELLSSLEAVLETKGTEGLHQMLEEVDPESASSIHPNNTKRVMRAIVYFRMTGKKISEHNEASRKKKSPYCFAYFVLEDDRDRLYAQIDARVDRMMEDGLLEEVRRLKEEGLGRQHVSMQGLGYKELLSYLDGEISLDEAVRVIKRDTRHFAKRQMTWFRRERDVIYVRKPDFGYDEERMLEYMLGICRDKGLI